MPDSVDRPAFTVLSDAAAAPSLREQLHAARLDATRARAALPASTSDVLAWLRTHGLGIGSGPGAVLAAARADVLGVCTVCPPEVPDAG